MPSALIRELWEVSLFLEYSAGKAGGLLINGNPGDRSVSLCLLPVGGEVRFADLEAVLLPWNACGQVRSVIEGPERDGWAIAHWRGRTVDDTKIADFARRHYLDIEPWPFAALVT